MWPATSARAARTLHCRAGGCSLQAGCKCNCKMPPNFLLCRHRHRIHRRGPVAQGTLASGLLRAGAPVLNTVVP
jgi:hypothetical protein